MKISKTDVLKSHQCALHSRQFAEEFRCGINGQFQDLSDVEPAISDLERLGIVASDVAGRAWSVLFFQEHDLHRDKSLAITGGATPTGYIERKSAGVVTTFFSIISSGITLANDIEQSCIGGQVRTRCSANRLLIHADKAAQ